MERGLLFEVFTRAIFSGDFSGTSLLLTGEVQLIDYFGLYSVIRCLGMDMVELGGAFAAKQMF